MLQDIKRVLRSARRLVDVSADITGAIDISFESEEFLVDVHWKNFDGSCVVIRGEERFQFKGTKCVHDALEKFTAMAQEEKEGRED